MRRRKMVAGQITEEIDGLTLRERQKKELCNLFRIALFASLTLFVIAMLVVWLIPPSSVRLERLHNIPEIGYEVVFRGCHMSAGEVMMIKQWDIADSKESIQFQAVLTPEGFHKCFAQAKP